MKERFFLISNDVETTSLWNHSLNDQTGKKVMEKGMPILLDLYSKYQIKSTFFFTGHIAKLYPEIVRMIQPHGHEIGSHGLTHQPNKAFDVLSFTEQVQHLKESKNILEDISGEEIISFRAPALRVNRETPAALAKTGFKIDSSVASQRLDFMFSLGAKNKMKWLVSPRKPYFCSDTNLAKKGSFGIMEIPLNALGFPYIGTVMRISPFVTKITRSLLCMETRVRNTPVGFIIHPNELIEEEISIKKITRRSNNYLSYLLADKLRYRLKLRNLGDKAAVLLENQLLYFKERGYHSITLKEYYSNQLDTNKSSSRNNQL